MRIAFLILLVLHAIIHVLWFGHSVGWVGLSYFSQDIPVMVGFSWLLAALLFLWSAYKLGRRRVRWFLAALSGVLLSQMWIFSNWEDTKFGSLANLAVLIGVFIGYAKWQFEGRFREEAGSLMENARFSGRILTERDLGPLPPLVREYIRRSGAIGQPVPENIYLVFEGDMREQGKGWFPFTSEQLNTVPRPTRLFFMKARIKGVSAWGYHSYRPPSASMVVRVLSLFRVLRVNTPDMYPTETVTFLNDLCLFAPGALIHEQIRWDPAGPLSVRATFAMPDLEVSALLYFDEKGDLVDFRSEDRYDIHKMQRFPFSTPVGEYREFGGVRLPSYGEAVWHYPEGAFPYGKFRLKSVAYNIRELPSSPNGYGR